MWLLQYLPHGNLQNVLHTTCNRGGGVFDVWVGHVFMPLTTTCCMQKCVYKYEVIDGRRVGLLLPARGTWYVIYQALKKELPL